MGREIDFNQPLSDVDKEYLKSRGRGYLIAANDRRFPGGDASAAVEHEKAGEPVGSEFYDNEARNRAVYDTAGAPLPGTTLDYDSGRAFDRDNGVTVEPRTAGHTPGQFSSRHTDEGDFAEGEEGENDDIDEDIADNVIALNLKELEAALKENGIPIPTKEDIAKSIHGNESTEQCTIPELLEYLAELEVQTEKDDKKDDLVKRFNDKVGKLRKERMQDALAIHLQDERHGVKA
jgi:hypothetical protein